MDNIKKVFGKSSKREAKGLKITNLTTRNSSNNIGGSQIMSGSFIAQQQATTRAT